MFEIIEKTFRYAFQRMKLRTSTTGLLLVQLLEMPIVRGKARAWMALQRPGMRDKVSRLQLSMTCTGQKIYDA